MNKFKVTICGKEFSLQSDEPSGYFTDLARKVESKIISLSRPSDNLTVHHASLLTALSYADDAVKANDSIDNIRTQIKGYVDDACRARNERDEMDKKLNELKKTERELKERINGLEKEILVLREKSEENQLSFEEPKDKKQDNSKSSNDAGRNSKPKTNRF